MTRITVDVDDVALAEVMTRYQLATATEAVNFALRVAAVDGIPLEKARAMRGSGWDGDLSVLRENP